MAWPDGHQTKLPARMQAPILGIPVPIAIGGLLAALAVGVLLAGEMRIGIGALLASVYAPVILLNLSPGLALFVPLEFIGSLPAALVPLPPKGSSPMTK